MAKPPTDSGAKRRKYAGILRGGYGNDRANGILIVGKRV
jgi:hypothetical protein